MHYVYQIYVSAYIVAIRKKWNDDQSYTSKKRPTASPHGRAVGRILQARVYKKNERAWLSIDYFKTIIYSLVISFQYMYTNNDPYEIY